MITEPAAAKHLQAKTAADRLINVDGVTGVCVFGSVARWQADHDSDIDILVVGSNPDLAPSALKEMLPASMRDAGVAISYYTPEQLDAHLSRSLVFGIHLQNDSWVVYDSDGRLKQVINKRRSLEAKREIARQRRQLRTLSHVDRFGGRYLFPLSHVYRIGRTVTYAQLADRGLFEFDQATAFRLLAVEVPEWRDSISIIERLSPFYSRTRSKHSTRELPFDPNGPSAGFEFERAYNSVAQISGEKSPLSHG